MDIEKIEDEMFMNSTFKKIILNDNIKSIGKKAFMDNVYLKEVEGKVNRIEESAFENAVSLNKIDLKETEEVGKDAFKYLGNRFVIYVEDNKVKKLLDDKYTIGKTTIIVDNKYFK